MSPKELQRQIEVAKMRIESWKAIACDAGLMPVTRERAYLRLEIWEKNLKALREIEGALK